MNGYNREDVAASMAYWAWSLGYIEATDTKDMINITALLAAKLVAGGNRCDYTADDWALFVVANLQELGMNSDRSAGHEIVAKARQDRHCWRIADQEKYFPSGEGKTHKERCESIRRQPSMTMHECLKFTRLENKE